MPTIESQINYRLQRTKKSKYSILSPQEQFKQFKMLLKDTDIWITKKKVYHLWTKLKKITINIDKKFRY